MKGELKKGDKVLHRDNMYMHAIVLRVIWNYYVHITYPGTGRKKVVFKKDLVKVQ